jgi:hypothetical protein
MDAINQVPTSSRNKLRYLLDMLAYRRDVPMMAKLIIPEPLIAFLIPMSIIARLIFNFLVNAPIIVNLFL